MNNSASDIHLILMPNGQKLPVQLALERATTHQQLGRYHRAETIYRKILVVEPNHADAMHLLGVISRQKGQYSEAIAFISKAIKLKPNIAIYYNNLSQVYRADGKLKEAKIAIRKAIKLDSNMPESYVNLGAIALESDEYRPAIKSYTKALVLRPDYIDAMIGLGDSLLKSDAVEEGLKQFEAAYEYDNNNVGVLTRIGIALRMLDKVNEAIEHYKLAIQRFPAEVDLYNNLAFLYRREGNIEGASGCYSKLLELTPDDETLKHTINSLEGATTKIAPADFVRDLFDNYAEKFESHLVNKLDYHTPELLLDLILSSSTKKEDLSVLDLGCGTGLMGVMLNKYSKYLLGVDLSPKIIEQARNKEIYDELAVGDVLEFMKNKDNACFDMIVSADVFVYIGELESIFSEVKRLLVKGGVFAFSVEKAVDIKNGYMLNETGRYAHAREYLNKLQEENGFIEDRVVEAQIRNDFDVPVYGYHCVYSKI